MSERSSIEWTDATWNPVTGCTKVSPGCRFCYAERLSARLQAMGNRRYVNGFRVTLHPDQLTLPLRWRRPRRIFVNSMSDLYHEEVPEPFIQQAFDVMVRADRHIYQILTKRSTRLAKLAPQLPWRSNIWQGVSVENARYLFRVHDLLSVPAAVRFLSLEPLLGPIPSIPLEGIHWVIVGGESGPKHRPADPAWVREIRDQCLSAGVAFFFKQWGGLTPKAGGRLLDGRTWDQVPGATKERRHSASEVKGLREKGRSPRSASPEAGLPHQASDPFQVSARLAKGPRFGPPEPCVRGLLRRSGTV